MKRGTFFFSHFLSNSTSQLKSTQPLSNTSHQASPTELTHSGNPAQADPNSSCCHASGWTGGTGTGTGVRSASDMSHSTPGGAAPRTATPTTTSAGAADVTCRVVPASGGLGGIGGRGPGGSASTSTHEFVFIYVLGLCFLTLPVWDGRFHWGVEGRPAVLELDDTLDFLVSGPQFVRRVL
jgi:hypothetical protein